jgi:integrase/recombinase XerD
VAAQSGLRDFAMMLVFLGAGLRVSEVTHLACKDIRQDGDGGAYIHVRAGKGRKDRLVPVEETVVTGVQTYLAAFKRKMGTNEPLFLAEDSRASQRDIAPMSTRSCDRNLKRLCREASVAKRISPHSLRHAYALACLRFSKDLFSVSKLLGHASVATTQTYVNHINILDMRSVVPGFLVGLDRETPA